MNNALVTTLIVKHLPDFIVESDILRSNYFKPYKPIDVRFMSSQAMMGFVFLDFSDRNTAQEAFERLKDINFGLYFKQVTVEYAKPDPNRPLTSPMPLQMEQHEKAAAPVSAAQGLLYPSNPHLKYYYPDPTPEILTNITHAMGTVPRFYTQVLHLMNKFNMPPPFGPAERDAKPSLLKRKHDDLLASDESELEDEEQEQQQQQQQQQQEKLKQARLTRLTAERQKEVIAKPATTPISHPPAPLPSKAIPKIKINIGHSSEPSLTAEQQAISQQCMPMSELSNYPAFKGYEEGVPSSRLYIKNLSKQTTQQDLIDLYTVFSKDVAVNLMTKGRLRDQAFVSFPDNATAAIALRCTNGYVLHDRPMAVQYGKETKQKEQQQ